MVLLNFLCYMCAIIHFCLLLGISTAMISSRITSTERPYIEDILDKYLGDSTLKLTNLALGSSYWTPPAEALRNLSVEDLECHRYGNIMGLTSLRNTIKEKLSLDLEMSEMETFICAGANQGFATIATALCDHSSSAVLLSPYYFSHKLALQLCGCNISICPYDSKTLFPKWDELESMVEALQPSMVVITSPSNPSGLVWRREDLTRIVAICKRTGSWLVVDQVYHDFLHDEAEHVFPCGSREKFNYDRIVHIFSFSKSFGMPGWRIGYVVYPKILTDSLRKIQDTVPTHASIIGQKLALECMQIDQRSSFTGGWVQARVKDLAAVREAIWDVIEPYGAIKTSGAFYFLVPLPDHITEEEAVDILARQFGVLLMPGKAFGAPKNMRLSYGSIDPSKVLLSDDLADASVIDRLKNGLSYITSLNRG